MDVFRDIIPSILQTKKNLSTDESFDKSYNAYLVNRALSYHYDAVIQANQMNGYPGLPGKLQYDYLLNSIRGYKRRFQPWQKHQKMTDVEVIREYYSYSYEKAKEALSILSKEQVDEIRKRINKGGTGKS